MELNLRVYIKIVNAKLLISRVKIIRIFYNKSIMMPRIYVEG